MGSESLTLSQLALREPADQTFRDNAPHIPEQIEKEIEEKKLKGLRKNMASAGLLFSPVYKFELVSNLDGGKRNTSTTLGNLDLKFKGNSEKLMGLKGNSFFLYGLLNHGGYPSQSIGDAQGTSNIETPVNALKLFEAWIQQSFYDDKFNVLVGLHDLNSEFYVTSSSMLLMNGGFGIGTELSLTGINGASVFPIASNAIRLSIQPIDDVYLRVAVFEGLAGVIGQPQTNTVEWKPEEGLLLIAETGFYIGRKKDEDTYESKYALGIWTYTQKFDAFNSPDPDQPEQESDRGLYLILDQKVTRDTSFFASYGISSPKVNAFSSSVIYGFHFMSPFDIRQEDSFLIGSTLAFSSNDFKEKMKGKDISIENSETVYEITYNYKYNKNLAIQPDLQYVINPSARQSIPNALVSSLRLTIDL